MNIIITVVKDDCDIVVENSRQIYTGEKYEARGLYMWLFKRKPGFMDFSAIMTQGFCSRCEFHPEILDFSDIQLST